MNMRKMLCRRKILEWTDSDFPMLRFGRYHDTDETQRKEPEVDPAGLDWHSRIFS